VRAAWPITVTNPNTGDTRRTPCRRLAPSPGRACPHPVVPRKSRDFRPGAKPASTGLAGLYCIVTRLEIGKVKAIATEIDETAFIVAHPLADVQGGVLKRSSFASSHAAEA